MTAPRGRPGAAATLAAVLAVAGAAGCSPALPPIAGCDPGHGITPDCRFHNPEDLAVSPSGRFLLVSQFGDLAGGRSGSLAAYAPAAGAITALYPRAGAAAASGWGDPDCPPPPAEFAPHGIDLEQLDDGSHALYVVNHGGRESVEMFQVDDDGAAVTLTWRGCAMAPPDGYFNDLVVLRDGGFWVSQMFPRDANVLWAALRMRFLGHTPGFAYRWTAGDGFREIPGTRVAFANGIEKSADESRVFLNGYFGDAVIQVDAATGARLGSATVSSPDNLTWAPTGELLVASHHASIRDTLACQALQDGSCPFRFQIVAIDPEAMSRRVLLDHEGPPMGAATVALTHGDQVYLGTFAGDRIARVPATLLNPGVAP